MRICVVAAALVCAAALPVLAQDRTVRVLNWSDYIDVDLLEEFTAETGIRVVYDTFDSNEYLEEMLLEGRSGYDVVVPSGDFLGRQIQAGLFQPLDRGKLPNLVHAWDFITERTEAFDPGGRYSVNYMWGTTGIGYNADALERRLGFREVETWDVIFEPELVRRMADCGVTLLDAPGEIVKAALNYLGRDPNSVDPADLAAAEALLRSIRPFIRGFDSSDYIDRLAAGEVCLVIGWSGDVLQARDRAAEAGDGIEIGYVTPEEGALMWFDQMAVPVDAPDPDAAHRFIDFMLRPDVIARASNYVFFPNGNLAAQPLLDAEVLNDPAVYPPDFVIEWMYSAEVQTQQEERAIADLWARLLPGT